MSVIEELHMVDSKQLENIQEDGENFYDILEERAVEENEEDWTMIEITSVHSYFVEILECYNPDFKKDLGGNYFDLWKGVKGCENALMYIEPAITKLISKATLNAPSYENIDSSLEYAIADFQSIKEFFNYAAEKGDAIILLYPEEVDTCEESESKKKENKSENNDDIEITEEEKDHILSSMLQLLNEGLSFKQIADRFNDEEIPTFTGKGSWQTALVRKTYNEYY